MDAINESVDILIQHQVDNSSDQPQMNKLSDIISGLSRPIYSIQEQNIAMIRHYFKNKNWLLLSSYATMNTMYLCTAMEFEQKVSRHFSESKIYQLIQDCSDINSYDIKTLFYNINQHINYKLYNLLEHHHITLAQYTQMCSYATHDDIENNTITFLPDTRMNEVLFRPILSNISPTIVSLIDYLYCYLQTAYIIAAQSTTFNDDTNVVNALETYNSSGLLQSNTQFGILEIQDFDITFIHKQVIDKLECFLVDYSSHLSAKLKLSPRIIIYLVRLILKTQYFMYEKKLYRQKKGGNPDSSFTKLLVNIYLLYWQKDVMEFFKQRKEVFGRCYNSMFFTWNGSECQINSMFNSIKTKSPKLTMKLSIGKSINYFNINISQTNGQLHTKIHRSTLTEPYTLPYVTQHPSDHYARIIRKHMIQAIRVCTNIEDFQDEHKFIYSICLLNQYPLDFIHQCVREFFHEFNPSKLNYRYNQKTYECFRRCVIMVDSVSKLSTDNKRPRQNDLDIENKVTKKQKHNEYTN